MSTALLAGIGLIFLSFWPYGLDHFYVPLFFEPFTDVLRLIFGSIPFSVGDLLIYIVLVLLLLRGGRWIFSLFTNKQPNVQPVSGRFQFVGCISWLLVIAVVFYLSWGMNYFRSDVKQELILKQVNPVNERLIALNTRLRDSVNSLIQETQQSRTAQFVQDSLLALVASCFDVQVTQFERWTLSNTSLKYSMWSWLGDLTGVAGYYNPFTAEAQLNRNLPVFLKPFVACHELAHQLGYANESEANFVGYLTCRQSTHPLFRYAAHLEMLMLANRQLRLTDTAAARTILKQCQPGVQRDLQTWRDYQQRQSQVLGTVFERVFDVFLKSNRQQAGIRSYDAAVMLLLSYEDQYGW
ncbi:MAG: DUF3810 domain-containing protein [Ferruginibacter sp.]